MPPPPLAPDLDAALATAYRRWDRLERSLPEGTSVLDFDLAPTGEERPEPFADRDQAYRGLDEICSAVEDDPGAYAPYLAARLRGSLAHLRACTGERMPFAAYLSTTMGCEATDWTEPDLTAWRDRLIEQFAARGIVWSTEGAEALTRLWGHRDGAWIGEHLPSAARAWLARVRRTVPDLPEPTFRVEVVREDAYWANWIDGDRAGGVRLRVNTHPRTHYNDHSLDALAAHEITGHALHLSGLQAAVAQGTAPGCLLGTTVHALDAFHQEGLAQVVEVLFGPQDVEAELRLDYRRYLQACLDTAQVRHEEGEDLAGAGRWLLRSAPLAAERALLGNLRDRAERPLHRSYLAVYGTSLTTFLAARDLPDQARSPWLHAAWTSLAPASALRATLARA